NGAGKPVSELYLGQPFTVAFSFQVMSDIADGVFEVDISTPDGTYVATALSIDGAQPPSSLSAGWHEARLDLTIVLMPGHYSVDLGLHHTGPPWTVDFVRRTLDFQVLNMSETGGDHYHYHVKRGFVRPPCRWRLSPSLDSLSRGPVE